jgi:UDP-2,3-diacylglucosamine pyrophosphatase LpxH
MDTTLIVSDLHIGSPYFLAAPFLRFLDGLPDGATLVLNGDTVDRRRPRDPLHRRALERLVEESARRRVVWVRGNHDARYAPRDRGRIEVVTSYGIGKRLFVQHGHAFDNIKHRMLPFVLLFRAVYLLRIWLGAPPAHVAFYAKKWPRLYRILRRHVALNAVEHARENGYAAVACGHVHFAEDTVIEGVRYLNTGSWTEAPAHFLRVTPKSVELLTQE